MEASKVIEAVTLCKNNKFDLLVLDNMMPKMGDFTAIKQIRSFSSVSAIMLSARRRSMINCLALGWE